jgi:DNA-binding NtrC family response regulator
MKSSDFTIVVAEDDLNLLNVYTKSLLMEGYRVVPVKSGERALGELYENEKPADLLITDIKMEDMDGFEMLPLLKRNHPQLPVIVISGTYERELEDFHKQGFQNVKSFFMKPLKMDILKRKIREILKVEDVRPLK